MTYVRTALLRPKINIEGEHNQRGNIQSRVPICQSDYRAILQSGPINYARNGRSQRAKTTCSEHELRSVKPGRISFEVKPDVEYERSYPETYWKSNEHRMDWMPGDACTSGHINLLVW